MDRMGKMVPPSSSKQDASSGRDCGIQAPEDFTGKEAGDSAGGDAGDSPGGPADDTVDDRGLEAPPPRLASDDYPEAVNEQDDFREHFDEDLYTDREERPAQGNTADVAMGDQRFGSDADAYAEYAWRRSGDRHHGEESAVGQSRDPADSRSDDTPR